MCEIKFKGEKEYLSVILDLYDRKVVACKIHTANNLGLVLETLLTARLYRYDAKNVIIHSDRGGSYLSDDYHIRCRNYGFQISMNRPGCPIDNSVIESFLIDFHDTDRISLPRKIREDRIFDYNKAIEKAKEFKNLNLKKIKL